MSTYFHDLIFHEFWPSPETIGLKPVKCPATQQLGQGLLEIETSFQSINVRPSKCCLVIMLV